MDPWTKKGSYRKNRAIPFVQTIFLDSFSCESSKSRTRPAISSSWNKFCTEIPLLPPNLKSQTKKPRDGPFQGSSLFSNTLTFLPLPPLFLSSSECDALPRFHRSATTRNFARKTKSKFLARRGRCVAVSGFPVNSRRISNGTEARRPTWEFLPCLFLPPISCYTGGRGGTIGTKVRSRVSNREFLPRHDFLRPISRRFRHQPNCSTRVVSYRLVDLCEW